MPIKPASRARRAPAPSGPGGGLFHASPAKLALGTLDGVLVDVNRAYASFFGFAREEMIGRSIAELGIISPEELRRLLGLGLGPGVIMRDVEVRMRARDGRTLHALMSADMVELDGVLHRVAAVVDITERKKLERRLLDVQKLESVARLAGGVAHDFNNMLTAIMGNAHYVLDQLPAGDSRRKDVGEILALSREAAELSDRLLAFGRRQILVPETVDLNRLVRRTLPRIRRLVGPKIRLATVLCRRSCRVYVDPMLFGQLLQNLAQNAADAMRDGGTLTFRTAVEPGDGRFLVRHPGLKPGPHAVLSVADTGAGMSEEVRARVFEPFFTTKGPGRGTGLGLSMAYGTVKQSGGDMEVDSAVGRGSIFRIFLPLSKSRSRAD